MSKIFIYSIPRQTATKISEWANDTSGKKLKKTKIGRCNDKLQPLYSAKVGGILNGLSYKPWMENGVQKTDENGNPLTLQDKMEQKWNKPKGYFTNRAWRKGDSLKEEDMTYFQKKSWTFLDGCTILDTDEMDDEIASYWVLDASKFANSEAEWRAHKWPKATYYIALENETEELKYKKNEARSKAFSNLHHKDLTLPMKRKFICILGLVSTKSTVTEEQVHNLLFEYIDKTTFQPGSNLDKFNEVFALLKTANGREEIEARYLLRSAMDNRIIFEKQGSYKWPKASGQITIGETYSEAIEFLTSPKKQSLVEDLEAEIKAKLKN